MESKRWDSRHLSDVGYKDPERPGRGWIRVLVEIELRLKLVMIARWRNVSLSTVVREALWSYLGETTRSDDMIRFNGQKNPGRRKRVESGQTLDDVFPIVLDEYHKTGSTYAVRMPIAFEVDTLEGKITGKKDDFLALGVAGELYPIDGAIFAATYERTEPPE